MKISCLVVLFLLLHYQTYSQSTVNSLDAVYDNADTSKVDELNTLAFKNRLIDPEETIRYANKGLLIAKRLKYVNGIAEAYRVLGVGKYYLNQNEGAIESYLAALGYFRQARNLIGEAKVYNNIGALYRDVDYDKSLEYLEKSLAIAQKLNLTDLIAGLYLNLANINQRKKNYTLALSQYKQSLNTFKRINNTIGIVQCLQNLGVIYFNLSQIEKAEEYLTEANQKAKENELNNSIASINLTLSSVYISQEKFELAKNAISEGASFAKLVKSPKLEYDYVLTSYELEFKRKNYERALYYLQKVYKQDSITYKSNVSDKISLLEAQHKQLEKQRENELTIARQRYTQVLFWAISVVAILAFVVIVLLIRNVHKSSLTNKELTRLNLEVSKQKDDLNRINHNQEEIINVRTKDLKIKNKKLSEYSSHLSHQIRSPVATLKGLMLLEEDDLIDKDEFVKQIGKCIYDLDDKIININENLNDPLKSSLINDD